MIALGIRYLTKYAVATNLARQPAEWPPHPGRIFMAMAASHFESGADAEERTALEWLATFRRKMCFGEKLADRRL
jgi:CRISPR-associated protein Csb2